MCGIAGCIGGRDIETVNKMLDALDHRGPDDRGVHVYGDHVLGHTRLSIVDVEGGHQPIVARNGRQAIICNGEIYNYRDLRKDLSPEGEFLTESDTEVILRLYQEKGADCVKDLDGMFAFTILDGDRFLMARDPLGIKPLYYGYLKDHLYFTSELGAMLGEKLAHQMMSDAEYERIRAENPRAVINSKEAAYYFKIFREFHPQDSILGSIGIWAGFDFAEEREHVQGTIDGDLKHDYADTAVESAA